MSKPSGSETGCARTLEIAAAVLERDSGNHYFLNFLTSLESVPDKRRWWRFYESKFASMSEIDWNILVSKVVPRFVKNDPKRKWQTAIDLLNEATAYNYFVSMGCDEVHLIAETNEKKTPDLSFKFGSVEFSCGVKTFNRSEESVSADGEMLAFTIEDQLSHNFLEGKLMNTINFNLSKFDAFKNTKKFYFFVLNFDDRLHEYADRYFKQLEQWLDGKHIPVDGLICLDNSTLWRDEPLMLELPKGLWKQPEA